MGHLGYARPPHGVPESFPALLGRPVVPEHPPRRLAMESRFADAGGSVLGRLVLGAVDRRLRRDRRAALALPDSVERDAQLKNAHFLARMMPSASPRSLAQSSSGEFPYRVALGLDLLARGRLVRGLATLAGLRSTLDG